MLEEQERVRMPKGVVVSPGKVPRDIRHDPERQREGRAQYGEASGPPAEPRWDREHEQGRRPLGEDDVLQKVRPQKRMQCKRLQLGGEGGEDQRKAGDCSRDAEPAR